MRTASISCGTVRYVRSNPLYLLTVYLDGDIAYADYWLKEEIQGFLPNTTIAEGYKVYETILNAFYNDMASVTAFKPYMVGPGNHEANCDNGGTTDKIKNITYDSSICMPGQTNFTGFRNHFRMPSAESGGVENFWYSFDHGMTHYIQLDTETDLGHGYIGPDEPNGSEGFSEGPFGIMNQQTTWLENDLKSVDRTKTPWVIVGTSSLPLSITPQSNPQPSWPPSVVPQRQERIRHHLLELQGRLRAPSDQIQR